MSGLEQRSDTPVRPAERPRRPGPRRPPAGRARGLRCLAGAALLAALAAAPARAPGAALLAGCPAARCRGGALRRRAGGGGYHGLTVQELRALLKDRGLVRKGRKEDLIKRLESHDSGGLDSSEEQTTADVAASAAAGRAVEAVRPGDIIYFRAHTGRHLEVERERLRARWDDYGEWQAFSIEKSPLVIDDSDANTFHSGDLIFLRAHTGHFVDVDGDEVRARWADQNHGMKWQGLVIVKHGNGAIVPGDTVFLQSNSGTYVDVQGEDVRARWEDEGEWQALVLEKS